MHPEIPSVTVDDLPDPLPAGYTVLDVREPVEWEYGHIDGAVHIPMMELPDRRNEIPEGHLLVVCKIGSRSMRATHYLAQQGYDVVNLDGGMVDWAGSGRPMLSENGRTPHVV